MQNVVPEVLLTVSLCGICNCGIVSLSNYFLNFLLSNLYKNKLIVLEIGNLCTFVQ